MRVGIRFQGRSAASLGNYTDTRPLARRALDRVGHWKWTVLCKSQTHCSRSTQALSRQPLTRECDDISPGLVDMDELASDVLGRALARCDSE